MNLETILTSIRDAGGTPLYVGGYVRDHVLGLKSKDIDIEVYRLDLEELENVLKQFGEVDLVGKSYGILKLHHLPNVDFSVPRSDNKIGVGHKDFRVTTDKNMPLAEAARRRDLTMNSMAMDPFTNQIFDPFNGQEDIKNNILRATDLDSFIEDPLRMLRVAQFISRFEMSVDDYLFLKCSNNYKYLADLPGERIYGEFIKLLLGKMPSKGLVFLKETNLIRSFPELNVLMGCEQEEEWHPEGDCWIHTLMTIDAARELTDNVTVLFAALCHDFGKPSCSVFEEGRLRSRGHEEAGVELTTNFLSRMKAPNELINACCALVSDHIAPARFKGSKAGPAAYRRLARRLGAAGTNIQELYLVAKADHFGRTTADAIAKEFPDGDEFLRKAQEIKVEVKPEPDIVMGRHLIAKGMIPGKGFGVILEKCRELQYQEGLKDPEEILRRVL